MVSSVVLFAVGVVVILAGAGIAAGTIYYLHPPVSPITPLTIQIGDNVTVNYIGIFGSGPDEGKVFDTSLYTVAYDSIAYPKSLTFSPRGPVPANFTPLAVHIGNGAPQSGYSLGGQTFVGVVNGFWEGLVGLQGNESKSIVVPPALGYGLSNPACVATKPLAYTVPAFQTLPAQAFAAQFPGQTPSIGSEFPDPHFNWPVLVLSSNSSFVTVENLPSVGWTASPAGWPVEVTNVTASPAGVGAITLTNLLSPDQAGHIVGKDYLGNGPCSRGAGYSFIVSSVDLATGTFTEDFNQEVVGNTLIFDVTVVDIYP